MTKENAIKLFQDQRVRVHWDDKNEKWYFSIIDVIGVLTESENPRKYWSVLKTRLKKEGSEVAANCSRLKLLAVDGKMRLTDVADTEQLLRLIQSIPSLKAEPFKVWLAKVGYERIEETKNPEKAFDRAMETYLKKGYSKNWINQRLKIIEIEKYLSTKEYNPSPHRFSSSETPVADRTIPIVYSCENCDCQISFKPDDFKKHNNSKNTNLKKNDKIIIDKYIKNSIDLSKLSSLDFYCPNCNQPTTILFNGGTSGYLGLFEFEIEKILGLKK